ncbi:MAG TPA: phosphotransferase, partial [Symbiobacteriaceae bacterium]|nr:phosphotransferase [Symbiobacteriaceae bacterium]
MELAMRRAVAAAGLGEVVAVESIGIGGESEIFRVSVAGGDSVALRQFRRGAADRAQVEWGVLRHLAAAGFPVPRLYRLIEDEAMPGPALLMELIPGATAARQGTIASLTPLLLQLHKIDPRPLVGAGRVWPDQDAAQLLVDPSQWSRMLGARTFAVLTPALAWVERALAALTPEGPALLHTDWHGQNILYRGDGSPVVIDWSSAAIGDPRFDVGYAVALLRIEGAPDLAAGILAAYEAGRGAPVADLAVFEALATLRRLGLFLTMMEEGGERLGFQPAAIEQIRQARPYVTAHLRYLEGLTGLSLPAAAA